MVAHGTSFSRREAENGILGRLLAVAVLAMGLCLRTHAADAPARVIYCPGWMRVSSTPEENFDALRTLFPGADVTTFPWEGDNLLFWKCRDQADQASHRLAGELLALSEAERGKTVLIGHSLGARIVIGALADLAQAGKTVGEAIVAAAAIPGDDPRISAAVQASRAPLVVVVNPDDPILKWVYYSFGEGRTMPLGINGVDCPGPHVRQLVMAPEDLHGAAVAAPPLQMAAMRQLCAHYVKFYLDFLAEQRANGYPATARNVVRQDIANVALPVVDGGVFWDTLWRLPSGWELQRHKLTGHCRVLDPHGIRRAWGSEAAMRRSFAALATATRQGRRPVTEGYTNVELPVVDGEVFWSVLAQTASGWKLERHKLTGHCRILDPGAVRRAWGPELLMQRKFYEILAAESAR